MAAVIRAAIGAVTLALLVAARAAHAQPPPVRDRMADPVGPGSISGIVVSDEGMDHPVRRATVQLAGQAVRMPRVVVSDDAGRFSFPGLVEGRYSIIVSKPGYVRSYAGARRPWRSPGVPIELAAGERKTNVAAVLQRGSVISGRVLDDQGQAVQGVRLQLMERRVTNGEAQLVRTNTSSSQMTTDDRGVYRLWGLAPGAYIVGAAPQQTTRDARLVTQDELQWAATQVQLSASASASRTASPTGAPSAAAPAPERGPMIGYAPVYYPGTTDAATASVVTLEAGQERSGIDFNLRFVPTAAVRGTVVMQPGATPQNMQLALTPQGALLGDDLAAVGYTLRTSVNPQGQFTFGAVGPGVYLLTARASSADAERQLQLRQQEAAARAAGSASLPVPPAAPGFRTSDLWAQIEIGVDGRDVDNVSIVFQRGMSVSGRVVFEATAPDPMPRMVLAMRPERITALLTQASQSQPVNEGRFEIPGMAPGRYIFSAPATSLPGQPQSRRWVAKSAMWNGRDLLDEGVEIRAGEDLSDVVVTYSDTAAEVTGAILDAGGKPVAGYFVMLFSSNRAHWVQGARRLRSPTQPQADGRFRFADLPAGEYCLALLTDYDPQDLTDPAFLEQVAAASIRITLAHGEKKVQDIKLKGSVPSGESRD